MKSWGWLLQYVIAILLALLLGALLGSLQLFRETVLPGTRLRASGVVHFIGYGSALLLLWFTGRRAALQIPDDGSAHSVLRHLLTPLVTLIVVLSGYKVLWFVARPFFHKSGEAFYDWIFIAGTLGAAFWLTIAWFHHSAPLLKALDARRQAKPSAFKKRLPKSGDTVLMEADRSEPGTDEQTVLVEDGGATSTLGRYEIIRELGRGAMGVVYLGRDPLIQRTVAIKTARLDEVDPEHFAEAKSRFFREAESSGRLSHPNIVTIYDAGEEDELGYIAMEVLEGETLKSWCRKENLLPVERVLEIASRVAEALDYAHSRGIVHRDIKPANIMVLKDGTVKVTDFGIARITTSSRTQTGVILGTPNYMSPEQLQGHKVDGRSDIFSLGVVFFELLTGEKPFQAENMGTLLYKIANQPHQPLNEIRSDLPPCCHAILERALQKEAGQRYQHATEMAQDLAGCLQSLSG